MRVLAIDLGSKNIGTAVSDQLGISLRPLKTIRRSSNERDVTRLKNLAQELEAEAVVVGLPLRLDGTVGNAAAAALKFAERLRKALDVPVDTQDERLTSYDADRAMIAGGVRRGDRKRKSDQMAAVIILRDYLARTATEK